MGYYNDLSQVERKRSGSGLRRLILTSVTSAVIGGLVVLLMVPTLSSSGYIQLPEANEPDAAGDISGTPAQKLVAQPISVSVNMSTVEAVEKVEDSVVGIINIGRARTNPWFYSTQEVERGQGSGVIFEKKNGKAHIITNYHVISGAEKLEVALPSGEKVSAKVLGYDMFTDLAVLEIDGSKVMTVAELGDSSTLRVGEPAIAIGNPLGLEFSRTVTQGIISSLQRSMPMDLDGDGQDDWELDVLQTDAAINPGNSGGALVNIYGQVIGINTLKISKEGIEGLGFAIPINDVKKIVAELLENGKLTRAYLGIQPYDLTNVPRYSWKEVLNLPNEVVAGVVVRNEVDPFSPAGKAGLRMYDVIVQLDNKPINNGAQLRKFLTLEKKPGDKVKVTFYRDGVKKTVDVQLSRTPEQ